MEPIGNTAAIASWIAQGVVAGAVLFVLGQLGLWAVIDSIVKTGF